MSDNDADGKVAKAGWSRWYREAREEMAFRYGVTGIATDVYKETFFLGLTVQQAVKEIAKRRGEA